MVFIIYQNVKASRMAFSIWANSLQKTDQTRVNPGRGLLCYPKMYKLSRPQNIGKNLKHTLLKSSIWKDDHHMAPTVWCVKMAKLWRQRTVAARGWRKYRGTGKQREFQQRKHSTGSIGECISYLRVSIWGKAMVLVNCLSSPYHSLPTLETSHRD